MLSLRELKNKLYIIDVQRVIERQHKVVITDRMWARLLSSTNQPSFVNPKDVFGDDKDDETQNLAEDGEDEVRGDHG